ncbi:MAG: zf-TFIIB domain-containing protein [Myxococcales bacterium]|nr:zf-TFIIB domain-containing protein [Myxococcales bacterium]
MRRRVVGRAIEQPVVLCPICNVEQVIVEWGEVELDVCIDGHGIWFDADELRHLFAAAGAPESALTLEARLAALPRSAAARGLRCPRCRAAMQHVTAPDHADRILLDRCPQGHGLWFDAGEIEQLIDLEVAAGDPSLAPVRAHLLRFIHPDNGEKEPRA